MYDVKNCVRHHIASKNPNAAENKTQSPKHKKPEALSIYLNHLYHETQEVKSHKHNFYFDIKIPALRGFYNYSASDCGTSFFQSLMFHVSPVTLPSNGMPIALRKQYSRTLAEFSVLSGPHAGL